MSQVRRLLLVALWALGCGLMAAETKPPAGDKPAKDKPASDKAKEEAKSKGQDQANAQREKIIADIDDLMKQLKNATAEQKKVILEKMQEQKKAFEEAQNALHKQIVDERRRQRQTSAPKR